MRIIALFAVIVLVAGITAAACGGGGGDNGGEFDITGEELIERVLANEDRLETSQFKIDINGNLKGTTNGEYVEGTFVVDVDGAIDIVEMEMRNEMTVQYNIRESGQSQLSTDILKMYFLDDFVYLGSQEGDGPAEWIKADMSDDLWESQDLQSQQLDLIRGSDVKMLRTENMRGVPCYVVEIIPDMDVLLEVIRSQVSGTAGMGLDEGSITNFKNTTWYARDTFFPVKAIDDYDITFEQGRDRLTGHYTTSMEMYNYNEPVTILLPREAENADYVGSLDRYL
ncbi:DUF6612 family protein [Chloroflexota bacterium]